MSHVPEEAFDIWLQLGFQQMRAKLGNEVIEHAGSGLLSNCYVIDSTSSLLLLRRVPANQRDAETHMLFSNERANTLAVAEH